MRSRGAAKKKKPEASEAGKNHLRDLALQLQEETAKNREKSAARASEEEAAKKKEEASAVARKSFGRVKPGREIDQRNQFLREREFKRWRKGGTD